MRYFTKSVYKAALVKVLNKYVTGIISYIRMVAYDNITVNQIDSIRVLNISLYIKKIYLTIFASQVLA